jgi:hypothetical protein
MKNFKEFLNEKFDVINNDLKSEIKEYLLTNYPSDWWNDEFSNRVYDYVGTDDIVGSGDEDDDSTWEFENEEEAYQGLCMGGAIEYDLLDEIRKDIIEHFHLNEEEYDRNDIGDIVEYHMCNVCDWYDKMLFGENSGDFLGLNRGVNDLLNNLPDEIDGIKL